MHLSQRIRSVLATLSSSLRATGLLLVICGTARAAPQQIERGWTLVREDLEVFIHPSDGEVIVEGSLVARLDRDETSPGPVLLINGRDKLMLFDEVSAHGADIEMGVAYPSRSAVHAVRLAYPELKKRGDEVTIHFVCHNTAQGRQMIIDETIALASWVEAWYPITAPPKGSSLGNATKVAGTTTFHLPPGWHAVTNGGLVSEQQHEEGATEVWRSDRALSRSFSAGPYTVMREKVGDLDVSLYLLSSDLPSPRDNVTSLAMAMNAMEERWGPYPYPSYAIAEVPAGKGDFGASSEQGFIMVKPEFLRLPGGNLPLFAHEAAHGWWGNTVGTRDPGGMICSETLAQYGAVIAAETIWGKEAAVEFMRFSWPGYVLRQSAYGYFSMIVEGRDKPLNDLKSGVGDDHTLSDAKGHWVIHMLRRRVGDELFFATMRALIDEFRHRAMSLDDLRARFVAAAPQADLVPFFEQWFERTGAPVLLHDWEETDGGVEVTLTQFQESDPYDLWVDLSLEGVDGAITVKRVHLAERDGVYQMPFEGVLEDVHLNADHGLLIWEPAYGPSPIPELADLLPPALDEDLLNSCAGLYRAEESGRTIEIEIEAEDGQLVVRVQGRRGRLVHCSGLRFRAPDGFLTFQIEGALAVSVLYIPGTGKPRKAIRQL